MTLRHKAKLGMVTVTYIWDVNGCVTWEAFQDGISGKTISKRPFKTIVNAARNANRVLEVEE